MLGLWILCGFVASLLGTGFWMVKSGYAPRNPRVVVMGVMALALLTLVFSATAVFAAETPAAGAESGARGLGFISMALSTGLACIGAGIGVAFAGAAALGVVGEKPSMLGKTLIYVGMAEGIAIYGFIISLFIMSML